MTSSTATTLQSLATDSLRIEVDAAGGAYLRSTQLFREGQWEDVFQRGKSLFVMAPYPNRVIDGCFPWQGSEFNLNHPSDPATAIHGVFRYVPWKILESSENSISLHLDSRESAKDFAYPSDYLAKLNYSLQGSALNVEIDFENCGNSALPFGTGPHMYGLRHVFGSKGPTLRHDGQSWFAPAPGESLPSSKKTALPETRRYPAHRAWSTDWDHCVADWGDSAEIHWPDVGLRLTVSDTLANCPYLQIWNTEDQDICALEPQTMVPTKLGDTSEARELGCRVIEPGESFRAAWKFQFELES